MRSEAFFLRHCAPPLFIIVLSSVHVCIHVSPQLSDMTIQINITATHTMKIIKKNY